MSDLTLIPPGVTHRDLVQRAAAWIVNRMNCRFVLCETMAGNGESPDAIGWKYGDQSHLVEVKVSRSDFLADRNKPFRKDPSRGVGMYRWFMVPSGMVAVEDLVAFEGWGLLEVTGKTVRILKRAELQPAINREAEVCILVQAVANAQLCAPMNLNDWFNHPESAVGRLRAERRAIAESKRQRDRANTCCWIRVADEQIHRCGIQVATGFQRCSSHGGRTRGEKRKQADVEAAYEKSRSEND